MSSPKDIQPGDYVGTRYRGGTREGVVEDVQADSLGKKAVFTTPKGKKVEHRLDTLAKDPDRSPSAQDASEEDKEQLRQRWNEEMGGGGVHK